MNLQKQAFINTSGNIMYFIALWLLMVISTKFMGYEAAGAITLAMTVGNMIATVQFYGVRSFQSSDIMFQYTPNDYIYARVITVVIGLLICVSFCFWMDYPSNLSLTIFLFMIIKSSESFSDALFGDFQRLGRLEIAGYSMFLRGIVITLFFVLSLCFFNKLNTALLLTSIGAVLILLLFDIPFHNSIIRGIKRINQRKSVGVLKICFPLFLSGIIVPIIVAFPRIILEHFYGVELLGFYGNVSTPALLLTTVAPTVLTVLLPDYGRLFNLRDYGKIRKIWGLSVIGTLVAGFICLICLFIFGRPVMAFIYTDQILPYVRYLYLILLAMVLNTLTICNNTVLVAIRKNSVIIMTSIIALVICLVISFPLVRDYCINGAIAVLIITYGLQMMAQMTFLLRIWRSIKSEII